MTRRIRIDFAARPDFRDPAFLRALGWSLPVSVLIGGLVFRWTAGNGALFAVAAGALAFVATLLVSAMGSTALAGGAAQGITSFLAPSGGGTPSVEDYSYEKSLLARGRVDAAVSALEVRLANAPQDAGLCLFLADVYARNAGDAGKAERLFLRVRELPGAAKAQDYHATTRLIDLYLGPLDEPARAADELERMRREHPGSQGAAQAGTALGRIRGGR